MMKLLLPQPLRVFRSERGIPLIAHAKNMVTCEDHNKWYHLYYIDDKGQVNPIDELYDDFYDIVRTRDHSYNPKDVIEFCKKHELKIDAASYNAIIDMWIEYTDYYDISDLDDEDLPTMEDASAIVTTDGMGLRIVYTSPSYVGTGYRYYVPGYRLDHSIDKECGFVKPVDIFNIIYLLTDIPHQYVSGGGCYISEGLNSDIQCIDVNVIKPIRKTITMYVGNYELNDETLITLEFKGINAIRKLTPPTEKIVMDIIRESLDYKIKPIDVMYCLINQTLSLLQK